MSRDHRPVFLNLLQIRLPIQGITSIAHRVSGVLLFLFIPVALWLLMYASGSRSGYEQVLELINSLLLLPVLFLLVWAFWHHLLAGIRFLLLDLDMGLEKKASRKSALLATVTAPIAAVISLFFWYA